MFWLIGQVFIALLSFIRYSETKVVYLNNKPLIIMSNVIDLHPIEVNYYPFIVILDKCNESCNAVDDLSTKIRVLSETKDVNDWTI